jgi:hypothetical protein
MQLPNYMECLERWLTYNVLLSEREFLMFGTFVLQLRKSGEKSGHSECKS